MKTYLPSKGFGRPKLCLVDPGSTPTLEEVVALLQTDRRLSAIRQRDLISSLQRISAACDLPPNQLFANPTWLRQKLSTVAPLRFGRSPKTRSNVLSNAMAALAHFGMAAHRPKVDRSAYWQCIWEYLTPSAKIALGSFTRYCSFYHIQPSEVSDRTVNDYAETVKFSSLRKKPEEAIHDLVMHWNRASEYIPGWPAQRLTISSRRLLISPPIEALPISFREDLAQYMVWLKRSDLLAADAAPPLANATIKHRHTQIRRFFGELVANGVGKDEIRDLRSMVCPDLVYRGLQAMIDRKGGSSGMIHGMAYTLLVIAKHYARLPDHDLQKLRTACARLKVKRQGMTSKNRGRLRQFNDPKNLDRILLLPEELLREAQTKSLKPNRAAALVEIALGIELLLITALRIKNLAALHLEDNLQWTRSSRRGICHLVVDGRYVKNQLDREFELQDQTVTLLKTFLDRYRPFLAPASCRWLFARRDGGGSVDPVVLGRRISKAIRSRTGLSVNVHLFRSLGAKIYLDQHPGGYEVARQVLGHKHLSTTTSAYTGMESVSAAKQFDQTIRDCRQKAKFTRLARRPSAMPSQ